MQTTLLQQETEELKALLDRQGYDYRDGADPEILESLGQIGLPTTYKRFLSQLDPGDAAWRIGGQFTVVLHSADEIADWQAEPEHFVIGSLNGEPLALEADNQDAPVYRLGEDGNVCVGSSLVQFLQILRTGLDLLGKLADYDDEHEDAGDDSYDDSDYDADDFTSGREDVVNDYLEEIESIDPDCVEAWTPA